MVRPNIQKKIADVHAWEDIMHKVHNGTVFIKGIYTSGNSRMAELVRPNIQKKIAKWEYYADTVFIKGIYTWDDIMHKVHNGIVFIKGIYSSGNSRKAELVRPNIQKKIAVTCIHEMILCM